MKLIRPSSSYQQSFLEGYFATPKTDREKLISFVPLSIVTHEFESFVEIQNSYSQGHNLPSGKVSRTIWWLIENDTFIGKFTFRHELTEELFQKAGHISYTIRGDFRNKGYGYHILDLGLQEIKQLRYDLVLLTVQKTNIPSQKIVEKNGGLLINEILEDNFRYIIEL